MRVVLVRKGYLVDTLLPHEISGNFWVTDYDDVGNKYNVINISSNDNNWILESNEDVVILSNGKIVDKVALTLYAFYPIKDYNTGELSFIYTCPSNENDIVFYKVAAALVTGVTIGSDDNCVISIKNNYVTKLNTKIIMNNNTLYVEDNNSKYGTYVDGLRINGISKLDLGSTVFVMGAKIMLIKIDNNIYLGINNLKNVKVNLEAVSFNTKNTNFEEENNDVDLELYESSQYFHRKPRFVFDFKEKTISIDTPPEKNEENERPMILTVGPMITMGLTSMIMGYNAISNMTSGTAGLARTLPSLVMCIAMLSSTLLWPMITKRYQKKIDDKKEKERQRKYAQYIEEIRNKIKKYKEEEENILNYNYKSMFEYQNIILNKKDNLWEKKIEDPDFLSISIGHGDEPQSVTVQYPEDHFSLAEDNLKKLAKDLKNEEKILKNVPIKYSLKENYVTSVIGNYRLNKVFLDNTLLQLMATCSYDSLNIVIFTNKHKEKNFDYLKTAPHLFNSNKTIRYFASTEEEYQKIMYNLNQILDIRKENKSSNNDKDKPSYDSYFLIITDSFKNVRNYDFIKNVLSIKEDVGFGIIILSDRISSLPEECKNFIELDKECRLYSNDKTIDKKFYLDFDVAIDMKKVCNSLANIPIEFNNKEEGNIPNTVGFMEMYNLGKIEQFKCVERWQEANPIKTLQAPLGIGKSGEKIVLDLHEKAHGPHGLIAGSTGSGKSELIITYILSMAVNYHPLEVQFILIDYKGGGLAGAFENATTGIKLPHLVGTITNLDTVEIKRSLASIESELKRRQKLFNKARDENGESTIDIYKYQKMYREGKVQEPVSHLFIISDEFAELKQQQPDFMDQLISTARIGRSLGVHLILATQKPAGIVDQQIWSNTRFRICMRVQEKSDSMDVIKREDAALLKQTGRFYLQVGYNEVFVLGQAAWAGGKYIPQEKVKKNIDTTTLFIDNTADIIKQIDSKKETVATNAKGEEVTNIIKYLSDLAKQQNILAKPLWLPKIPDFITVDGLIQKYGYKSEKYVIDIVIGEYDIPNKQEQHVLTIPFSNMGNALLYGAAGSGKENFLTSMIYSGMTNYSPDELSFYIIDFGSEQLRCFTDAPSVGDIMYVDDEEKINNCFKMLEDEIEKRKGLFANYSGSYYDYCTTSGKSVPNIVVVINSYEAFAETYPKLEDKVMILTRDSKKYGIYFIFTSSTVNGIRYRLKPNFAMVYSLQQNNEDDYSMVLGNVRKTYPSKIYGRGLFRGSELHEFQTAFVCEKSEINSFIKEKIKELKAKYQSKAKNIPILPDKVTYKEIKDELGKDNSLIIGIDKEELDIVKYDFRKDLINIIATMNIDLISNFLEPFINQILVTNNSKLFVLNMNSDVDFSENNKKYYSYFNKDYDNGFSKIYEEVSNQYENLKKYNFDKSVFSGVKNTIVIVIGVSGLKGKLNAENQQKLNELFDKTKQMGNVNFIFADTLNSIKAVEYEQWYKTYINTNNGIFIGNGLNEQMTLKIARKVESLREYTPDNFCYVLKKGYPYLVQYVEELKIK